jgi:hypothetical protein
MLKNHKSHYKKIRGWKRRIKQIEVWGEQIKQPYLKSFNEPGDYTYDRCFLYPFYVLEKRQPPLWFYKRIVAKFVLAYSEWEKIFNDLNVPYDLQLWIYDPNYMWSEILCRRVKNTGDRIGYSWESELNKPFPYKKFSKNDVGLKQFEWLLADEQAVVFENELEDDKITADELIGRGYVKKMHAEHGVYYAKRLGDVWVGRKKKA